jgi:hypothetical protein
MRKPLTPPMQDEAAPVEDTFGVIDESIDLFDGWLIQKFIKN